MARMHRKRAACNWDLRGVEFEERSHAAIGAGNITISLFTAAGVRFQNSVASASFTRSFARIRLNTNLAFNGGATRTFSLK
jgi:hypothetical protein